MSSRPAAGPGLVTVLQRSRAVLRLVPRLEVECVGFGAQRCKVTGAEMLPALATLHELQACCLGRRQGPGRGWQGLRGWGREGCA